MEIALKVEGLRELQRSLRQMEEKTPKLIQSVHKDAAKIVLPVAQRKAGSAELAGRIIAVGTTKGAALRFKGHRPRGTAKSTDALLQEFGGRAPLFGNKNHWYTVKPKKQGGYIIYPAIKETRHQVEVVYLRMLDEAIRRYWSD